MNTLGSHGRADSLYELSNGWGEMPTCGTPQCAPLHLHGSLNSVSVWLPNVCTLLPPPSHTDFTHASFYMVHVTSYVKCPCMFWKVLRNKMHYYYYYVLKKPLISVIVTLQYMLQYIKVDFTLSGNTQRFLYSVVMCGHLTIHILWFSDTENKKLLHAQRTIFIISI